MIERGAVEGEIFHRGAVGSFADGDDVERATRRGLVRKELIRPSATTFVGDHAFRFRHLLIRDAAYDALPKETRADLHERFATWLEAHARDLVELDEIVGYHLEQAARYRRELGQTGRRASNGGPRSASRQPATRRPPATICRQPRTCSSRALALAPAGDPAAAADPPSISTLLEVGDASSAGTR